MLVADREMAAAHPEVVGGAGARRSRHWTVRLLGARDLMETLRTVVRRSGLKPALPSATSGGTGWQVAARVFMGGTKLHRSEMEKRCRNGAETV